MTIADEPVIRSCDICSTEVVWIEAPTGGWWKHFQHPDDDHDAEVECGVPCCDYRDHEYGYCACPEHEHSEMHPFGGGEERWGKPE